MIAAFVIVNLAIPFLWLIALGGACNFTAISANDGVMPASASALEAAGMHGDAGRVHQLHRRPGRPPAVPRRRVRDALAGCRCTNVYSIGDVLIVIGALLAVHTICGSRAPSGFARGARGVTAASRPRPVPSDQPA